MKEEVQMLNNPTYNTPSSEPFRTDSKVMVPQNMTYRKDTLNLKSMVQNNSNITFYLLKIVQYLLKDLIIFFICEKQTTLTN